MRYIVERMALSHSNIVKIIKAMSVFACLSNSTTPSAPVAYIRVVTTSQAAFIEYDRSRILMKHHLV